MQNQENKQVKTINLIMVLKIAHQFKIKKKQQIKLVDKRLEEITKFDKNADFDNFIYSLATDTEFDEFDNALILLDRIKMVK